MVDSSNLRRDHGKKRHHHHHYHQHHHKSMSLEDDVDLYQDRPSKRTSDQVLQSDKDDEDYRSHHHKSKKQKHDRDEDRKSRSKHRRKDSPKDRSETHHPVRVKEEPPSPKQCDESSKTRSPKSSKSFQSLSRRRHESRSPNQEVPRKNGKNHHTFESNSRGDKNHEEKKGVHLQGGSHRDQDFKKGKRKLGAYSPSGNKYEWGKKSEEQNDEPTGEKEKPNFALSGKLTEDRNMYNGVVIKYSEPPEARKPKRRWRLYPFKGDEALPMMHIHRQSAFLLGRDHKVVDIPIDHPSCSKQHAALQYRLVQYEREDGSIGKRIRLYVIDLESANGTYVNNNKIEPRKYVELMEKDVIKFGYSSREYVLLHDGSQDTE